MPRLPSGDLQGGGRQGQVRAVPARQVLVADRSSLGGSLPHMCGALIHAGGWQPGCFVVRLQCRIHPRCRRWRMQRVPSWYIPSREWQYGVRHVPLRDLLDDRRCGRRGHLPRMPWPALCGARKLGSVELHGSRDRRPVFGYVGIKYHVPGVSRERGGRVSGPWGLRGRGKRDMPERHVLVRGAIRGVGMLGMSARARG